MSHARLFPEEIAFFEFKKDYAGKIRFGSLRVLSQSLVSIKEFASIFRTRKETDFPERDLEESDSTEIDWTEEDVRAWFLSIHEKVHSLLSGKLWVGHGIIGSDIPRLKAAFAEIGKDPPVAESIIDTHVLLSPTKLGKIAVLFGLGNEGINSYVDCLQNLQALRSCVDVLLVYEPDLLKKHGGGQYHPMFSYLSDLKAAADNEQEMERSNAHKQQVSKKGKTSNAHTQQVSKKAKTRV